MLRAFSLLLLTSCVGPRWNASALLLDAQGLVAETLGDDVSDASFDKRLVPQVPAPTSLRPCCAFGMDLTFRYVGLPLYFIPNIVDVPTLGPHEYDNGMMTLQSNGRFLGLENNGLVYTCRGGFIDLSHVRDNADMTFFLATRMLAELPGPLTIDFTTNDAKVHVEVNVPPELIARHGRFLVAAQIAEWLGYQQGTWHEIAQWWGYESVRGYSEQVSAFSPDDFYSNALGVRLGGLAIRHKVFRSREDYNAGMDAWLGAALKQLGAVPFATGRSAMQATDGVWWDSRYDLPDNRTVPRRSFEIETPVQPWIIEDMAWPARVPAEINAACMGASKRSLFVDTQLDGVAIDTLATIEWTPRNWARDDFPYASQQHKVVTPKDFPRLVVESKKAMVPLFDPGFEKATAACEAADLEATLKRIANESGARVGVAVRIGERRAGFQIGERFMTPQPLALVVAALQAIDKGELPATLLPALRTAIVAAPSAELIATVGSAREAAAGDPSTPEGAVELVLAIARLSRESRDRLLAWMRETPLGVRRIKGAIPTEISVEHVPLGDLGDVGLITLPDGEKLAIAAFVEGPKADVRDATIAAVARAAYQCWKHRP